MSNSTWFQDLYNQHYQTFLSLSQVANEEDTNLRLSITSDGMISFSSDDGRFVHTITQDKESLRYTQFEDFTKSRFKEKND